MTAPQALLEVHHSAARVDGPQRALLLAGLPPSGSGPADEPLGRTTARLLRVLQMLAGPEMAATVACPSCAATVEFGLDLPALIGLESRIVDRPDPIRVGHRTLRWRPVSYGDLIALADTGDDPVELLMRRCAGQEIDDQERERLVEAMAAADPLAELEADLCCPDCSAPVRASVDIADFVWAEVAARARTLLAEVDILARTYSWSEAEILALPATRRAWYVDAAAGES